MRRLILPLALSILACSSFLPERQLPTTETSLPSAAAIEATPTQAALRQMTVMAGNWNCRDLPDGKVVAYASAGQVAAVLGEQEAWLQIDLAGTKCWIKREALK